MDEGIQKYIVRSDISLAQAMQIIDVNAGGVLFLVDEEGRLQYSLTDGDMRRFLLAGGQMTAPSSKAANPCPLYARSVEKAAQRRDGKHYTAIPIVDEQGVVIDIYLGENRDEAIHAALDVPVVINAGGRGTRLEPFTKVLPKPLIPVGDLPIIEIIMQQYQSYSCNDFHVIVNYKRDLIKAYFADNDRHYDIAWYDEYIPLGTGGGLSLLRGKIDTTFFFSNCDNLLLANYERILEFHRKNSNVITMVCACKNFSIPYGVVEMGINGKIDRIKEKPMLSFLINTGIYVVEPDVLQDIADGVAIGFPDIVEQQRQKGNKVAVFPVSESEWLDMGQLSELEKMRTRLYGE
ncbi:MAG: NTP transferase domain-containing protein [Clostridia bacterium]|nr:NTP transferase domain-containing protein [Clostridia bacterium]